MPMPPLTVWCRPKAGSARYRQTSVWTVPSIPVSYTHLDVYKRQVVRDRTELIQLMEDVLLALLPKKEQQNEWVAGGYSSISDLVVTKRR